MPLPDHSDLARSDEHRYEGADPALYSNPNVITNTRPQDVFLGRGRGNGDNPGNQLFTRLVNENVREYMAASKLERSQITERILGQVQSQGGRFIKHDKALKGFIEIGNRSAKTKIGQAIRYRADAEAVGTGNRLQSRKLSSKSHAALGGFVQGLPQAQGRAGLRDAGVDPSQSLWSTLSDQTKSQLSSQEQLFMSAPMPSLQTVTPTHGASQGIISSQDQQLGNVLGGSSQHQQLLADSLGRSLQGSGSLQVSNALAGLPTTSMTQLPTGVQNFMTDDSTNSLRHQHLLQLQLQNQLQRSMETANQLFLQQQQHLQAQQLQQQALNANTGLASPLQQSALAQSLLQQQRNSLGLGPMGANDPSFATGQANGNLVSMLLNDASARSLDPMQPRPIGHGVGSAFTATGNELAMPGARGREVATGTDTELTQRDQDFLQTLKRQQELLAENQAQEKEGSVTSQDEKLDYASGGVGGSVPNPGYI